MGFSISQIERKCHVLLLDNSALILYYIIDGAICQYLQTNLSKQQHYEMSPFEKFVYIDRANATIILPSITSLLK